MDKVRLNYLCLSKYSDIQVMNHSGQNAWNVIYLLNPHMQSGPGNFSL